MITPGRETNIYLDATDWKTIEPAYKYSRWAKNMFKARSGDAKYISYRNGIIVKPYSEFAGKIVENHSAQSGFVSCVMSSEFSSTYMWAKNSSAESPGVSYGADVPTQSLPLLRKSINASTSFGSGALTGDGTAYPAPTSSDSKYISGNVTLDRVAYTTSNFDADSEIIIFIDVERSELDDHDTTFIAQFVGPPSIGADDGYMYALCISMNRQLVLMNRQAGTWVQVGFLPSSESANGLMVVVISKSSLGITPGSGPGGYITVSCSTGNALIEIIGVQAMFAVNHSTGNYGFLTPNNSKNTLTYKVPASEIRTLPVAISGAVRVDMRRDIFGGFAIYKQGYPTTSITINDDSLALRPTINYEGINDYYLYTVYKKPAGCTVTPKFINDSTGTEMTVVSSEEHSLGSDLYNSITRYEMPELCSSGHLQLTLQASGDTTPEFYYYHVQKEGIAEQSGPGETLLHTGTYAYSYFTKLGIIGQTRSIDSSRATLDIADLQNKLDIFETRAGLPIKVVTTHNGITCVLFRGYVQKAVKKIHSAPNLGGVAQSEFATYTVMCNGVWQKLKENFIESPCESLYTAGTNEGMKVTDIIKALLARAGFPEANGTTIIDDDATQDIIDLPIRVIPFGKDSKLILNPLDDLFKLIETFCRDYLGHFLVWDDNLGNNGKWVLKEPPHAFDGDGYVADVPVAVFYTNLPSHIAGKKIDYLPSYENSPVTVGEVVYEITGSFIKKSTWESWVKPPEANEITVTGAGELKETGSTSARTVTLYNFKSFNVFPDHPTADSTHPDYLGRRVPLWIVDYSLEIGTPDEKTSISAIRTLAKRVYDLTAHAIKRATFEAPLVIIPHPDDPTRVRPLRFYDLIYIDDTPWLIRSCNPTYVKDHIQMATYEVEAPRI